MRRSLSVNRDEAEMLVDLCENTYDSRLWELASDLREQFGMKEQEMKDNRPKAAPVEYLGLKRT